MGVAYKPYIDDLRESGSLILIRKLLNEKIRHIQWSDPRIKKKISINAFQYNQKGVFANPRNLKDADIFLLMTDHDKFNYSMIYKNSKLIIDCRGRFPVDYKVIRA